MASPRKRLEPRERAVRAHRTSGPKPQIKRLAARLDTDPEARRGRIRQASVSDPVGHDAGPACDPGGAIDPYARHPGSARKDSDRLSAPNGPSGLIPRMDRP
jgi:hypothetical protein